MSKMEENKKYLFSCIISVLNGEKYLEETLKSIRDQNIGSENIQMIIVNDGSTDGTMKIVNKYEKSFGETLIIENQRNMGVGYSLNRAMESIKGEYSFFFGSDDLLDNNVLEEVSNFFATNDVEMISVFIERFGEINKPMLKNDRFEKGNRVIDIRKEYESYQILNGGCFFKSESIQNRRYNEKLNHFADGDYMLRFVEDYGRYAVLNSAKIYYRIKPKTESLSRNTKNSTYIFINLIEESYVSLINYSKDKNNGKVSLYMQNALIHRMLIYIKRTSLIKNLTSDEYAKWFSGLKYVLSEIKDEIILKNNFLKIREKILFFNIKHGNKLNDKVIIYKNGCYCYKDTELDISLKESIKVGKILKSDGVHYKIESDYFDYDKFKIKIKYSIFPFFINRRNFKAKIKKKEYFFKDYGEFDICGFTAFFKSKYKIKEIRIDILDEEIKYTV